MIALLTPITFIFVTLCLQWVSLGTLNDVSLKVPYVALALVILYACTGPQKIANMALMVRRNAIWIAPFAGYLLIMGIILSDSPAANSAPRQALYLIGSIALAASLAANRHLARTFRFGAALGIVVLLVAVEVLARSIGLSWSRAIEEFISGNLSFVVYSFFREVFNAVDPTGDPLGASTKNEVAVGALVLGLLFRSTSKITSRDFIGMAFIGLVLGLLLLLNTRSVIIAAGLSLIVVTLVSAARQPHRSLPFLLVKIAAAIALVVLAAGSAFPIDAVSSTLGERFAFTDDSTASRLDQYQAGLAQIELHPLTGSGYFEVDGRVIHNLFISAWVQGGLPAFIFAVLFYVGLLGSWLAFIWRAVKRPRSWVLPIAPEWIAALPIMPLFRVWSSGDGGNMYLGEWVAVACFFGCCLANELRSGRVARSNRHFGRVALQPSPAQSTVS